MDTKWKKWKLAVSFLAFFLGVSLLLGGGAGMLFVRWGGGRSVGDAFASDYQNTAGFRRAMSDRMFELFELVEQAGAQGVLPAGYDAALRGDENILYVVRLRAEGDVLRYYANGSSMLTVGERDALPEGYNFWMRYENGSVAAWKDGVEVDLYGDGEYRGGGQWRLPGYRNYSVEEPRPGTVITLAAAEQPTAAREGGSGLYYLVEDLRRYRTVYTVLLTVLAAGGALLVWCIAWHKYKKAANQAVAAVTGRIWLEVKLVGMAGLLWLLLGVLNSNYSVWNPFVLLVIFAVGWALYFCLLDLRYNGKEVFANSLFHKYRKGAARAAAEWTGKLLLEIKLILLPPAWVFFTVALGNLWYLLRYGFGQNLLDYAMIPLGLFCAWIYLNDVWRNGAAVLKNNLCVRLFDALRAGELKYPVQRRMERAALAAALAHGPFLLILLALEVWVCWQYLRSGLYLGGLLMIALALLLGVVLALPGLLAWRIYRRQRSNAADLGALLDQIAAVQGGSLDRDFPVPEDADLAAAAGQLAHIRQGLRTALDEQLRSERMKVELISNVSHDLKTPLTSILSYAELLRQEEDLPEHVKDYIRILDEKARRLGSMVQEVFEVSKAATGELKVRSQRLDFKKLLEQTLADMADPIEKSGLIFRTELPPGPVFITGDGDRLYRVFQNLIQNVLQYALEGSRVYVRLETGEGEAAAKVKNVSRAELPAGLDFTGRFVRGDESRTDGGSGLGLAIAASFVRACGGRFTVETDADLFTASVIFPLAPGQ